MRIYLFRHGEPQTAVDGLVAGGGTDCELSDHGREMTLQNARHVVDAGIDCIITTGMHRTDVMGRFLNTEYGIPHMVEADFREWHLGSLEGGTWNAFVSIPRCQEYITGVRVADTEPTEQLMERVSRACDRILALPHKAIAINGHFMVNNAILNHLLKHDPRMQYRQDYGCLNVIETSPEPTVMELNTIRYNPSLLRNHNAKTTIDSHLSNAKTNV